MKSIIIILLTGLACGLPCQLLSATWYVGPGAEFSALAPAIAAAAAHDHIIVLAGHYRERELLIDKPLRLTAEPGVIIDAENRAEDIFLVTADSVEISGFTLQNVGVSYRYECSAIRLREVNNAKILDNRIINCYFGIYLETAGRTDVINNYIQNKFVREVNAGNAIHAWKSEALRIHDNVVTGHRDGIYFEFVDDSTIECNDSYGNIRYGLHFMFSNRDAYRGNIFRDNAAGVAVMFSHDIEMIENEFLHNWGGASYGLLLKEISDGRISHNRFFRNTIGILAEGANRLVISENQFTRNGTAIDIKGNCLDNQVLANNFLANTFEVVTNSKHNNNEFAANYWSGYLGYDLDRNGIGDVPYRPVDLFAKITHEIPAATMLLHSNIIDLLEIGEKNFPRLIPLDLIDSMPRIRPYAYD
ncbi:nitrous oxide reductase family maturation protein NosD [Neolewinella antarctica]|uniref:Nitrous oxidase accessory protein n=1 Tax=Neolewinella antarctica TaxID=442734 RepID=A0ABX0XCH5_9BACT|nr:nitrous oxide reductase family maturation protein NosD [Neolewinella antarctica]NJC26979.1 nitrous oxidase accessory protein [Neolewinella antarctica]